MSQNFYGSVCLTDLIAKAKSGHSSFNKAQNGKIYCNVTVWLNDEEDKYGNVMSIQANPTKEMAGKDEKFYLGNCKKSKQKTISDKDFEGVDDIDLPTKEQADTPDEPKSPNASIDDLPF